MKLCINCAHLRDGYLCGRFAPTTDMVTGCTLVVVKQARSQRGDVLECGPAAQYFTPKQPVVARGWWERIKGLFT